MANAKNRSSEDTTLGDAPVDLDATPDVVGAVEADAGRGGLARSASLEIERLMASTLAPGLYLVATPIGNLGDITIRALTVLARADVVYCEDTRHSRTLASHYRIGSPLRPYHEHNGAAQRPRILAELDAGKRIALISDAGTPLVSDPGFKLVREAAAAGHRVESLPGPSAALAALTSAGLPTDRFLFAGFLPPRGTARRSRIAELQTVPATLVLYEAPQRLVECLEDLAAGLGPRPAAVARELTKLHEEVVRGDLVTLAQKFAAKEVRGELAIVVGPPLLGAVTDDAIAFALLAALADSRLKEASRSVAEALGVAKGRVYEIGLRMKSVADDEPDDARGDDRGET